MSFNVQQTQYGIAFKPQTALHTANVATDFWRVSKVNAGFNRFGLTTESDAMEIGKGSEFAEAIYPVAYDISGSIEKILSSELAAWAFAFGMGTANMTYAAGAYTFLEADSCDGLDMPAFSVMEQLGAGCPGGAGLDRVAIGCAVNDFGISFQNGPGRSSAKLTVNFVGSGANAVPSMIVMPVAKLVEHEIRGGSATVTINGVDYVAGTSLLNLDMSFNNALRTDQGYFIGSGVQDGAALRGRMERGNRVYSLNFSTRLQQNSLEYTKLKAMTTGPATITLANSLTESISVTFHKVGFKAVDVADDNGIATVQVACEIMRDTVLGVLIAVVKTAIVGIGGAA